MVFDPEYRHNKRAPDPTNQFINQDSAPETYYHAEDADETPIFHEVPSELSPPRPEFGPALSQPPMPPPNYDSLLPPPTPPIFLPPSDYDPYQGREIFEPLKKLQERNSQIYPPPPAYPAEPSLKDAYVLETQASSKMGFFARKPEQTPPPYGPSPNSGFSQPRRLMAAYEQDQPIYAPTLQPDPVQFQQPILAQPVYDLSVNQGFSQQGQLRDAYARETQSPPKPGFLEFAKKSMSRRKSIAAIIGAGFTGAALYFLGPFRPQEAGRAGELFGLPYDAHTPKPHITDLFIDSLYLGGAQFTLEAYGINAKKIKKEFILDGETIATRIENIPATIDQIQPVVMDDLLDYYEKQTHHFEANVTLLNGELSSNPINVRIYPGSVRANFEFHMYKTYDDLTPMVYAKRRDTELELVRLWDGDDESFTEPIDGWRGLGGIGKSEHLTVNLKKDTGDIVKLLETQMETNLLPKPL